MKTPCYIVRTEIDYKYIKNALNEFGYNTDMLSEIFCPNYNLIVLNLNGEFGICNDLTTIHINDYNRYLVKNLKEFIIKAKKLKEPKTNSNNNTSTNMKIPCYFVYDNRDYNHIKNCLNAFGYDTSYIDEHIEGEKTLIVLNFENVFGQDASLKDDCSNSTIYGRYVEPNIFYFIDEAARLKGTTYREHRNEIMGNSTKDNTMQEPKLGDKVLVRHNSDVGFVTRIYIGKIHGKYACVSAITEESYNNGQDFSIKLWNEMVPKITITKKDIAEKFNIPLGMFEIK